MTILCPIETLGLSPWCHFLVMSKWPSVVVGNGGMSAWSTCLFAGLRSLLWSWKMCLSPQGKFCFWAMSGVFQFHILGIMTKVVREDLGGCVLSQPLRFRQSCGSTISYERKSLLCGHEMKKPFLLNPPKPSRKFFMRSPFSPGRGNLPCLSLCSFPTESF